MLRAVATRPATYLRKPVSADGPEFVDRVRSSWSHLVPWVFSARDLSAYRSWIAQGRRSDTEQFLVCRREDDAIAGFVNINNIVLGSSRSASVGWAAFLPFAGRGHLGDGVAMTLEVAFTQLRLHRIEANVQPGNERSRQLAIRSGLRLEGFSPRLLKIGGEWRDHERWAILVEDWRDHRRARRTGD